MADLEQITERMREVALANADFGKSVKFSFMGDGVVHVDKGSVSNEDKPADCTFVMSMDDFDRMDRGELEPTSAFMSGRLKILGDMSVAMQLQPILNRTRG